MLDSKNLTTALAVHLIFVIVYSLYYFRMEFLYILIAPIFAIYIPIEDYCLKKYLTRFKKNEPQEVAIILSHSDWTKLKAWVKPNASVSEVKLVVAFLKREGKSFSFYKNANFNDVEEIMSNKEIKEVYFIGHGDSHVFQLNTNDPLYYCDFNDKKYGKDFVHQIHCGTPHGKSLIDYVVPDENKSKCFLIRKSITSSDIKKAYEQKINEISS
ncbi:MAG: hypothetical protein WA063_00270 [Minisyncoccia bacterium]